MTCTSHTFLHCLMRFKCCGSVYIFCGGPSHATVDMVNLWPFETVTGYVLIVHFSFPHMYSLYISGLIPSLLNGMWHGNEATQQGGTCTVGHHS